MTTRIVSKPTWPGARARLRTVLEKAAVRVGRICLVSCRATGGLARSGTGIHMSALLAALCIPGLSSAHADTVPNETSAAMLCEGAAAQAAAESGVPLDVLRAISLTETGRNRGGDFEAWPWTVNMEGRGVWFKSRDEGQAYVDRHFARGARSFDVGCFQINYRWHGDAFRSLEEMFDPLANARYAARFLSELHAEFGNWSRAAGAYHSRTPKFANRYRARFDRIRSRLEPPSEGAQVVLAAYETAFAPETPAQSAVPVAPVADPPDERGRRHNLFPLLQTGLGTRATGSLVPLSAEPASGRRFLPSGSRG